MEETIIKLRKESTDGIRVQDAQLMEYDNTVRLYKSSPSAATLQIRHFGQCPKDSSRVRSKQKPERYIFSARLTKEQLEQLRLSIDLLLKDNRWSG